MATGGYAVGYWAIAHCMRCGDKHLLRHLVHDGYYPDLMVCTDCWDPKHPQDYLPDIHDPETLYKPTGDLDKATANLVVISYPPWKFIYGANYPTFGQEQGGNKLFDLNGPTQTRPRLESPVKQGGRPLNVSPDFKTPGLVTLELDNNNKFTIDGGGVTDA